ncbi:MAG: hypothetical protein V3T53_09330 [Phycisphaerales bacterium]
MTDCVRSNPARCGFTLIDLMMTITIIIVAGALVLPKLSDDKQLRLMAAAGILTSDIELAQVMTISHPADAVVVRFDPDNDQYWLAYVDVPDTPIPRSDNGRPYLIVFGQDRAHSAVGVSLSLTEVADDTLVFDAQGGVADISAQPVIRLSLGARFIDLQIASTTGTITQAQ